jgi:hypothetical protein
MDKVEELENPAEFYNRNIKGQKIKNMIITYIL